VRAESPEAWFCTLGEPARAADAGDHHPFVRKYALFSGGRWPLGVYGDRFAIF